MKKIILLSSLASTIALFAFTGGNDDAKSFAKKVFECVKKNDTIGYRKLYVTAVVFDSLIDKSTWSDEKKARMKTRITEHAFDSLIPPNYHKIRTDFPLKWSSISVDSVSTETKPMDGLMELRFAVYFTENKKCYRLMARKTLLTTRGWRMADKVSITVFNKEDNMFVPSAVHGE